MTLKYRGVSEYFIHLHLNMMDNTVKYMSLPVMEHFYTLQGEGYYQGQAAYFIRIAGCDVGCHWCDVKESWDASLHPKMEISELSAIVKSHSAPIVVITGGEPLMYNMDEWTSVLKDNNLKRHIETSGAYSLTGEWDWITFSPKKFKEPHPSILDKAHELKVIVYNKFDFEFAEKYAALVSDSCKLYLQPEWDKSAQVLPSIIAYIKDNPRWQMSLQTHKFMDIP